MGKENTDISPYSIIVSNTTFMTFSSKDVLQSVKPSIFHFLCNCESLRLLSLQANEPKI